MGKLQPENEREALLMLQATAQAAQTLLTCLEVAPLQATHLCHLLISSYRKAAPPVSESMEGQAV